MPAKTKFTDRSLAKLPAPPTGQIDYFDAILPNFGLRVSHGGARTWIVLYRYNGKKRRMKLGRYPELGLAAARDLARDALEAARKGKDAAAERKARQSPAETISDLIEMYINEYAKIRKRSWQHDSRILKNDIEPLLGRLRIRDVGRQQVGDAIKPIADRGSLIRANRAQEIVRKMFNWAIDVKFLLETNPAARVAKIAPERARSRFLSKEEYQRLFGAFVPADLGDAGCLFFSLIATLGLRKNEILQLAWNEVDLDDNVITIPPERTKNGKMHVVPLPTVAASDLSRYQYSRATGDSPYVFPSPNDPLKPVTGVFVDKRMVTIRKKAKLENFRLHDLRRSATTYWGLLKIRPHIKDRLLNHRPKTVTDGHYDAFQYIDEKREALEKWEIFLHQLIEDVVQAAYDAEGQPFDWNEYLEKVKAEKLEQRRAGVVNLQEHKRRRALKAPRDGKSASAPIEAKRRRR